MRALDLFCCCGAASLGLRQAGFSVIHGVDIDAKVSKYYPFDFIHADVLSLTVDLLKQYDFIWASPPCQAHSLLKHRTGKQYVNLIPETRQLLLQSGKPYVIENVEQAAVELDNPIKLCGTMFDLGSDCRDDQYRQLQRHRVFETNFDVDLGNLKCKHYGEPGGIYGNGGGGKQTRGYKFYPEESIIALKSHYMPRKYASQAIPPAYSKYIAEQWLNRSVSV